MNTMHRLKFERRLLQNAARRIRVAALIPESLTWDEWHLFCAMREGANTYGETK